MAIGTHGILEAVLVGATVAAVVGVVVPGAAI
jgi:hypothetical protein